MSVQVVKYDDGGHQFELLIEDLERILLHDEIKDREVVCVSIAGAFRKGKSFLLNFFLRYLNERYEKKSLNTNWIGEGNDILDGFSWRSGSNPVTTGIHLWSNIFLHDFDDGRKVAIILLDTQGTFDTRTTMKNCTTIFALSTLLSSVQIFNLMQNIQENDLQHLHYFSEYGRLVAEQGVKPFQKLVLLVRDWQYPHEHEYGPDGGQILLEQRLATYEDQNSEHESIRNHIKTCFTQVRCFLMPHPGRLVATSKNFQGKLSDIDFDFKNSLLELVPLLLAPENLIVKKINGQPISASLFLEYFKNYFVVFRNGNTPAPMTLFNATATVHNQGVVRESQDFYSNRMRQFCFGVEHRNERTLLDRHTETHQQAIQMVERSQIMGGSTFLVRCLQMLNEFINTEIARFLRENQDKLSKLKTIIGIIIMLVNLAAYFSPVGEAPASLLQYILGIIRSHPRP